MKKWLNKKETYISKRESYDNRMWLGLSMILTAAILVIGLALTSDYVPMLLRQIVFIMLIVLVFIGILIIVYLSNRGLFHVVELEEKGSIFYKLHIYKKKYSIKDPEPEEQKFESFSDAEAYYEHGPDWEKEKGAKK